MVTLSQLFQSSYFQFLIQLMKGIYKELEEDARVEWANLTMIESERKCSTCNSITQQRSQEFCLSLPMVDKKNEVTLKTLDEVVDKHFGGSNEHLCCGRAKQRLSIKVHPQVVEMKIGMCVRSNMSS